ncbi:MAG: CRISPR-associated endoribonuclease Cas6 [Peptococcaceae bacterium]
MRLEIFFKADKPIPLPIDYNHIVQSMLYHNISPELAVLLHDQGFQYGGRKFKLFTFSKIMGEYRFAEAAREIVFSERFSLIVTSPLAEFCQQLGNYMMLQEKVRLLKHFVKVEKLNITTTEIDEPRACFTTLSPITIYSTFAKPGGGKYTCYFEPGEKEFVTQLEANLRKKYYLLYEKEAPAIPVCMDFQGRPKRHIIKYKDFMIKGYSGKFTLHGPAELLQLALEAGVGSKNSQGFGCLKLC